MTTLGALFLPSEVHLMSVNQHVVSYPMVTEDIDGRLDCFKGSLMASIEESVCVKPEVHCNGNGAKL